MEFRILGPIEVTEENRPVALGAAKQRALLALLLLRANEVVSSDRLVEELWGERPPAKAAKNVQVYVSQLRRVLGDGRLETQGHGYLLRVEPGALDAERFLALLDEGREALAAGEAKRAAEALRAAVGGAGPAPGRPLQELERAILTQDDALEAPGPGGVAGVVSRRSRGRSGVLIMAGAAVLLTAAIAAAAVELLRGGARAGLASVAPDTVAVIDPKSGEIVRAIPVGARPTRITVGEGGLWTANFTGRTLSRIDPERSVVVGTLGTDATPTGLAAGEGSVWVADEFAGTVSRVDPGTNTIVDTIRVGGMPAGVAVGAGAVWIADAAGGVVIRLDPTTNALRTIRVGAGPADITVGAG